MSEVANWYAKKNSMPLKQRKAGTLNLSYMYEFMVAVVRVRALVGVISNGEVNRKYTTPNSDEYRRGSQSINVNITKDLSKLSSYSLRWITLNKNITDLVIDKVDSNGNGRVTYVGIFFLVPSLY